MRSVRDLPIGVKLALSSGAALFLLVALTWQVQSGMRRVDALERQSAASEQAARDISMVRQAEQEMRVTGRTLLYQQSVPAAQATIQRAEQEADEARATIRKLVGSEAGRNRSGVLAPVESGLADYDAALHRVRDLRTSLIETRDNLFFPQQKSFNKELDGVRAGLAAEDIPYAELAPLRSALEECGAAVASARAVTLRFLITADRSEQPALKDAAASIDTSVANLIGSPISDELKSQVGGLAATAHALQRAAEELFGAGDRLDSFLNTDLDRASQSMQEAAAIAFADFADRAAAVRAEAAAAMVAARQRSLMLAAGIAVLLLASGAVTTSAIARPIRAMTRAVQSMAAGDTGDEIGFQHRHDEVGRMAAALETLRGAVRAAFVQSQMIEQMAVGIMRVDLRELRISYCNPELLRRMEAVRSNLSVSPDAVQGEALAALCEWDPHLEQILAAPERLPHRFEVGIGPEVFEVRASALRNRDGSYVGRC